MPSPTWFTGAAPAAGVGAWPSRCAICQAWPSRVICATCLARWAPPVPRCHRCALPCTPHTPVCSHCLQHPPRWQRALASVRYTWPWSTLLARHKYHAQAGWTRTWAQLMRRSPQADELLAQAAWVLPMPMSEARWAQRGYHPAALLAQALAPGRCLPNALLRWRHAPPQAGLARPARWRNVAHNMVVEPGLAHHLLDRPVLLVDDVMTTGASLDEASRAVLQAGARSVQVWVLARAEGPGTAEA